MNVSTNWTVLTRHRANFGPALDAPWFGFKSVSVRIRIEDN